MKDRFEQLKEIYKSQNIEIQTDFSKNNTVFNADLLITDWSAIAYEYAFTTKKPVLFINTPMKVMNPEYKKIDVEPFNIWARNEIGQVIETDNMDNISQVIEEMFKNNKKYSKKISKLLTESVYNIGNSSTLGAEYIIDCIQEKIKERKENK